MSNASYSSNPKQESKTYISDTSTPVNPSTPSWQQLPGCFSPKSTLSYTPSSTLPEQPNNSLLTTQSDKVFMSSLSIIEYTYALQNEPDWRGWTWQIQAQQPPWHALHVVLSQLCTRDWEPVCERTWTSAKRSFDNLPEALRRDDRYQQLLMLASAVQRDRADKLHYQASEASMNAPVDLTSATALTLSFPLAQVDISGTVSTRTPQEPFSVMVDNSNFSDFLGLEMDWQVWNEIDRELDPSLQFCNISGLQLTIP